MGQRWQGAGLLPPRSRKLPRGELSFKAPPGLGWSHGGGLLKTVFGSIFRVIGVVSFLCLSEEKKTGLG